MDLIFNLVHQIGNDKSLAAGLVVHKEKAQSHIHVLSEDPQASRNIIDPSGDPSTRQPQYAPAAACPPGQRPNGTFYSATPQDVTFIFFNHKRNNFGLEIVIIFSLFFPVETKRSRAVILNQGRVGRSQKRYSICTSTKAVHLVVIPRLVELSPSEMSQ